MNPNPVKERLNHVMQKKKSNLAVAADFHCCRELLDFALEVGSSICCLKTHVDILEDFYPSFPYELREIAERHEFILFEDRKFADIGSVVKEQYLKGIYRIAEWAHLTNAHLFPGPGIIEGLKEAGLKFGNALLLIAEMSSKGAINAEEYAERAVDWASNHSDFVIGFICQRRLCSEGGFFHMTPGIQLQAGIDPLGQQYNTIEDAILHKGTDIIIVGRGITRSEKPAEMAELYREKAWENISIRMQNNCSILE